MSPSRFAVRNFRFVVVVTAALFVLGVLGFLSMPRQEDPNLSTFGGLVTVILPGASVDEVEDRVLEPLEEAIHELEEVDEILSTARDGVAVINAQFLEDADKDEAYDLLVQRVAETRDELPDGVTEVDVRTIRPLDVIVFQLALWSDTASAEDLRVWGEELEDRLRPLGDAGKVRVEGARERQVHVTVDPARLAETGLSLGAVVDRIAAANADIPGGVIQGETRRISVRPLAKYEDLGDVEETVLATVDGRPVRVGNVAEVAWGTEDPTRLTRFDGHPAVFVTVTQKEDRNIFDLARDVQAAVGGFRGDLPGDITLSVMHDQSESVRRNLNTFGGSLLQGGIIIILLVALFTGWRSAVAVLSALLLSVGISFFLLERFGVVLHQMSIAGLITVLGLLVDNAIVVVEGILQERLAGADAGTAAVRGTDGVAAAVASSTATTIAAFVPMILTAGSVGEFTRTIPLVVSVVLVVSLAVAVFVTPLVAWRLFRGPRAAEPGRIARAFRRRVTDGLYDRTLAAALRHRGRVILGTAVIALACLSITPLLGMSFFPKAEKPVFLVQVEAPQGTNIRTTEARMAAVDAWLRDHDEVEATAMTVGEGNPQVYYNQIPSDEASHLGEIFVRVHRREQVTPLARALRERFADDPGLVVEAKEFTQGPPVGLPVSIELTGDDLASLAAHAERLEEALRAIPGAVNVNNDLRPGAPRLDLQVDPVTAGKLGLSTAEVAREIRFALAGGEATLLRQGDEDYPVVVRVAPEGEEAFADLDRVRLPLAGAPAVPLSQLTRPVLSPTYAAIHHTDLKRSVVVGADVDGRLAADVLADLLPAVERLDLGPRESWRIIGEDEERDRAFLSMLVNLVTAIGLIYGILVLQFRSFRQPLVVFTSLPVALTGSALGLLLGGWSFGFTAFIGLLALTGIVVNNAIVLVDRVNGLRAGGADLESALREGARSRLQPIVMTTATTIAGLLPLTLSRNSLWSPMGWVIIGGLLVSTVVTLYLVPALYAVLEGRGETVEAPERVAEVEAVAG